MESRVNEGWFADYFREEASKSAVDFVSRDETVVLEIQNKPQGMRGMYAGLMQLAVALHERPDSQMGCLVMNGSRISSDRIIEEWKRLRQLLIPKIACRLALIAIRDGHSVTQGDHPMIEKIATAILQEPRLGFLESPDLRSLEQTSKQAEILKVLLSRWLLLQGAIGIGELGKHVGCSYPTVRKTLDSIETNAPRLRVGATESFPAEVWAKILATSAAERNPIAFFDRSGQRPDPDSIIKRLNRLQPRGVAFGGVVAARHWHPSFDLNGTPRIDLVVHCPDNKLDLQFLRKVDPALKEGNDKQSLLDAPILVIHTLSRRESDFLHRYDNELPVCDPVETALDLIELGLSAQANDLFAHLRNEVGYS